MDRDYSDWGWSPFPFQQDLAVQGDGSLVPDASLVMPAGLQDQAARSYVPSYWRPVGSEQDMAYEGLRLTTPSTFQSQVARPNGSRYQLPTGGEYGRSGLQGDVGLVYGHSQFAVPANSQDQVTRFNAPSYQLPINTGNTTSAVQQHRSVGYPPSRSVAPTPSQNQVSAQPSEHPPSVPPECPACKATFRRVQERNRHLESHLPHSIYCPSRDCNWTGRRQSHFKEHWDRDHTSTDRAPGKELNEIYDPKEFVKLIVDGTSPVGDAAQSAFLKAQERLVELGKEDVGTKVWGRNKK